MLFVKEKPVMVYRDMQSLTVTPGEDAELSCEITKCDAKIKWLKDGKIIRKSPKYEFSQMKNLVTLVIHNSMTRDSGEYCCEVGGTASRARLEVKGEGDGIRKAQPWEVWAAAPVRPPAKLTGKT
ncbi:hypothetical protein SKAU_G00060870 [Synaphobranchus kaupii]|uniref:Ig-like domain-containing protein n=1 Tax=Synaphobranchus kaupii TaxID=118154 RepID=A0A9Q1G5W0_SYNKA|nr:hypothetical protein SKAU_G00060870 [Synaphobranchus kaupii]